MARTRPSRTRASLGGTGWLRGRGAASTRICGDFSVFRYRRGPPTDPAVARGSSPARALLFGESPTRLGVEPGEAAFTLGTRQVPNERAAHSAKVSASG